MTTTQRPLVGIGVLIFKGKSLLLGKRQNSHGAQTWSPPGGHLEFGETPEECALREVQEETGLQLDAPRFAGLTNDVFTAENKHYVTLFLSTAFPLGQTVQNIEPEKTVAWEWFELTDLPENLFLPLRNLIASRGGEFLLNLADSQREAS